MKEFEIESDKFSALCTLKSHLISLFSVEILLCGKNVFLALLLTLGTVHFLWGREGWWVLEECNLKIA